MKNLFFFILLFLAFTATAHPGTGIVMDRQGNIYYTDLKQVWRLAPDKKRTVAVPNVHTHELYLDAKGFLYGEHLWYEGEATDKWGHYVWRLSPEGRLDTVLRPREGFLTNYSFVRDSTGNMYWPDRGKNKAVLKGSPDGTITLSAGKRFDHISWMTCTPAGTIYLIDHHDLKRVKADGEVVTLVRDLTQRRLPQVQVSDHHMLMGIWTDKQENVYVADYSGRSVHKVTQAGEVRTIATSAAPWSPTGGLIAPDGKLWLLESSLTNEVRVREVIPQEKPYRSSTAFGWWVLVLLLPAAWVAMRMMKR